MYIQAEGGGGVHGGLFQRREKGPNVRYYISAISIVHIIYIYYTGDDCQEANSRASSYMGRNVNSFPMLYVDEKSGPNDCTMVV
jgi:hypothetical protein